MFKKILACVCCACLLLGGAWAQEAETVIVLGEAEITVNGNAIPEDVNSDVYLAYQVETHEDVPGELEGIANRVVTIAEAGNYRVSGKATDVQIAVRAGSEDKVRIILDGADITCRTAPAIAVYTALEPASAGEYGITIETAAGSASTLTGSHTEEMHDDDIKLSGAISSLVSLGFEGEGYLNVLGDNEGIEVKFGHMTFNGGNIIVNSADDPLNASEDNVSVITVNAGTLHLYVQPDEGGEGDGMDSNGAIVINGGTVVSYAHPASMDSGIDSDLGCIINGGIVLGAGNMYDEISAESAQLFMALQFARKVNGMIVVTDLQGEPVAVYETAWQDLDDAERENMAYFSFVLSSPDLPEGDYHLYLGGELKLEDGNMIYIPGKQLQHGGFTGGSFGFGGMPGMPKDWNRQDKMPEPPQGLDFPGDMQPPQDGRFEFGRMPPNKDFGGNAAPEEASTVFHLAPGSTMFSGIAPVEE